MKNVDDDMFKSCKGVSIVSTQCNAHISHENSGATIGFENMPCFGLVSSSLRVWAIGGVIGQLCRFAGMLWQCIRLAEEVVPWSKCSLSVI